MAAEGSYTAHCRAERPITVHKTVITPERYFVLVDSCLYFDSPFASFESATSLRPQFSLLANISASGLFEFYRSFFSHTPSRVFSLKPPAFTKLTSAGQRGSDHQQYPESQHISAPAAICPLYCIQLPPAFHLRQDLDQPPTLFFLSFPTFPPFPGLRFPHLAKL